MVKSHVICNHSAVQQILRGIPLVPWFVCCYLQYMYLEDVSYCVQSHSAFHIFLLCAGTAHSQMQSTLLCSVNGGLVVDVSRDLAADLLASGASRAPLHLFLCSGSFAVDVCAAKPRPPW